MIRCLILGSGGAVPTAERAPAGYWVSVDGRGLLVDPGPGALVRLLQSPHGPGDLDGVDAVLLSHLHLDHCADVPALLFALHSPIPRGTAPLLLAGPPGTAAWLERLRALYGDWLAPARRTLVVAELPPGAALAPSVAESAMWAMAEAGTSGAAVSAFAANHTERRFSAANLGFRFRDRGGSVLVYSGDGEEGAPLREAAAGADLLVVECSTPDELATPGHMTPRAVIALCRAAAPRRVVLTHLYPPAARLDLAALVRAGWDGPVEVARDGGLYEVPAPRPEPAA